jgi:hypothetical protein
MAGRRGAVLASLFFSPLVFGEACRGQPGGSRRFLREVYKHAVLCGRADYSLQGQVFSFKLLLLISFIKLKLLLVMVKFKESIRLPTTLNFRQVWTTIRKYAKEIRSV